MTKQRRRAAKRRRHRPDLDPAAVLVACERCGKVQGNRSQVRFLGPTEPCGNCGHTVGTYAPLDAAAAGG